MIPIVLHHGFMGLELKAGPVKLVTNFPGIDRAIAARGHPVIISRVHPTAGIATRARQLKEIILRQRAILGRPRDEQVVIIAHSMGGLDARYMIRRLGMADRTAALLTITAPHRGTTYAAWCLRHLGQRLGGLQLFAALGLDVQSVSDLTPESCARFNDEVPDHPDVRYFSVGGARPWHRVPPFALHAYKTVFDAEGENDGLVSVRSSTWGEHLGVWPADHFHSVGKRLVFEVKEPTGAITPFYLRALDHVLARVDGALPSAAPCPKIAACPQKN
jgi:triacylglycerol lipase